MLAFSFIHLFISVSFQNFAPSISCARVGRNHTDLLTVLLLQWKEKLEWLLRNQATRRKIIRPHKGIWGLKQLVKKPFLQLLSLRKLLCCILTDDNMDCVISLVSTIEVEKKRKKENLRIFPRSRKKEKK